MTSSKSTDDDDDIAKLFRENDDIGAQSSLWFRPLRQLLDKGKPTGAMTVLALRGADTRMYPFGVLTQTKNDRIVFWPILPTNADMVAGDGKNKVIDHITLEFPNEKTHVTAYCESGEAMHRGAADFGHHQSWRLQRLKGTGLAIWFSILVKWSVLEEQETVVQRCMKAPTPADAERRKRAFASHVAQLKIIDVPLPSSSTDPQYVYCVVYCVTDPNGKNDLTSDIFLLGDIDSEVNGCPDGSKFEIREKRFRYEQSEIVIATACPPGIMREEVTLGFFRRSNPPSN